MPLFVDPQARRRLMFDDHPDVVGNPVLADLRGQWIEVVESVGDADWQEIGAAILDARQNDDQDWALAFSGRAGIERMARWITGASWRHPKMGAYPTQNLADRRRWLGDMFPPVADAIRKVLDAHVQAAWTVAEPVMDPKAAASSGQPDPATPAPLASTTDE